MEITKEFESIADRIGEALFTVHRGVIRVGESHLVVFGNDGYQEAATRQLAEVVLKWLERRGLAPTAILPCAEGYTWAIVVRNTEPGEAGAIEEQLWAAWAVVHGHQPPDGQYQRAHAACELDALGGGYRDCQLREPLNPKAGPVRGAVLSGAMVLAAAQGGEDVHLILAEIPYPAKVVPQKGGPEGAEGVVVTEAIGNPRSTATSAAEAYLHPGHFVLARDIGERRVTTGLRMLAPVDPVTGEFLPVV